MCESCRQVQVEVQVEVEYRKFWVCRECAKVSEPMTGMVFVGVWEALALIRHGA